MLLRSLTGFAALGGAIVIATGACSSGDGERDQNYGSDAGIGWRATGLGTIDTTVGGGTGFTSTQLVPGTSGSQSFGDIAVLNDGSVLIAWCGSSGQGPVTNGVARDADGVGTGSAFGAAVFSYSTNVGGFDFIPAQNSRSVDSEPSLAVAPPGSTMLRLTTIPVPATLV